MDAFRSGLGRYTDLYGDYQALFEKEIEGERSDIK